MGAVSAVLLGTAPKRGEHNDPSVRMALGDRAVDTVLVVRPVTRERSNRIRDLVEQGADLGAVIDIVGC